MLPLRVGSVFFSITRPGFRFFVTQSDSDPTQLTEESEICFWQMFSMIRRIQTLLWDDRRLVYIRIFLVFFNKNTNKKHTNTNQHSDQSFWSRQCQLLGCKGNWWLNLGTAAAAVSDFRFHNRFFSGMLFIHTRRLNVSLGACIILWSGCERPASVCSERLCSVWEASPYLGGMFNGRGVLWPIASRAWTVLAHHQSCQSPH